MIIRSQDKTTIWNFDNVNCIHLSVDETFCHIKVWANGESLCIGHYSTDKKAIKVLDDIFYAFRNMAFVDVVTFQMPQDDEVD